MPAINVGIMHSWTALCKGPHKGQIYNELPIRPVPPGASAGMSYQERESMWIKTEPLGRRIDGR